MNGDHKTHAWASAINCIGYALLQASKNEWNAAHEALTKSLGYIDQLRGRPADSQIPNAQQEATGLYYACKAKLFGNLSEEQGEAWARFFVSRVTTFLDAPGDVWHTLSVNQKDMVSRCIHELCIALEMRFDAGSIHRHGRAFLKWCDAGGITFKAPQDIERQVGEWCIDVKNASQAKPA